jgi:hypothetical protein
VYAAVWAEASDGTTASSVYYDYWYAEVEHCYASLGTAWGTNRGKNILPNPTLETDLTDWGGTKYRCTLVRDSAQAHSGSWSAKAVATNPAADWYAWLMPATTKVKGGTQYAFSCWIYHAPGNVGTTSIEYVWAGVGGASNVLSSGATTPVSTTGAWVQRTFTSTAPVNADTITLRIRGSSGSAEGDTVWIDDVQFEVGSSVSATVPDEPDQILTFSTPVTLSYGDSLSVNPATGVATKVTAGGTVTNPTLTNTNKLILSPGLNSMLFAPTAGAFSVVVKPPIAGWGVM